MVFFEKEQTLKQLMGQQQQSQSCFGSNNQGDPPCFFCKVVILCNKRDLNTALFIFNS